MASIISCRPTLKLLPVLRIRVEDGPPGFSYFSMNIYTSGDVYYDLQCGKTITLHGHYNYVKRVTERYVVFEGFQRFLWDTELNKVQEVDSNTIYLNSKSEVQWCMMRFHQNVLRFMNYRFKLESSRPIVGIWLITIDDCGVVTFYKENAQCYELNIVELISKVESQRVRELTLPDDIKKHIFSFLCPMKEWQQHWNLLL
jgi:hypothetical protein